MQQLQTWGVGIGDDASTGGGQGVGQGGRLRGAQAKGGGSRKSDPSFKLVGGSSPVPPFLYPTFLLNHFGGWWLQLWGPGQTRAGGAEGQAQDGLR